MLNIKQIEKRIIKLGHYKIIKLRNDSTVLSSGLYSATKNTGLKLQC